MDTHHGLTHKFEFDPHLIADYVDRVGMNVVCVAEDGAIEEITFQPHTA